MEAYVLLFVYLVTLHWILDYPLQGQFLSDAKNKGPHPIYHLTAHAGIQAGGLTFFLDAITSLPTTVCIYIGAMEFIMHWGIDYAKVKGKTNFMEDQAMHIMCKFFWVFMLFLLYNPDLLKTTWYWQ